jgi:uncharacterized protein
MEKEIIKKLRHYEKKYHITILYACESGSRAWGFESPDSDYDIRFVFARDIKEYLSLIKIKETLDFAIENDLDFNGWDLKKFLFYIYKSNSILFEWLQSPVVYHDRDNFKKNMTRLMAHYFRPRPCLHHYLGLTKQTFLHFGDAKEVKLKKYFYVLRPLLAARYIFNNRAIPPMEFHTLIEKVKEIEPLIPWIHRLVEQKKISGETAMIQRNGNIDTYVREELATLQSGTSEIRDEKRDLSQLHDFFISTLMHYSPGDSKALLKE